VRREAGQDGAQRAALAAQCRDPSVERDQAFGLASIARVVVDQALFGCFSSRIRVHRRFREARHDLIRLVRI
jgi:hypothetical protein